MGLSWDKTGPVCFRNRSDWLSPEKATSGKKDVNSHLREGDWWLLELQEVIWRRNKRIDRSSHKTSREHRLYRNPAKSWHGFSKGVLDTVSNYLGSFLRGYCFSLMLALNSGPKGSSNPLADFFSSAVTLCFITAGRVRGRRLPWLQSSYYYTFWDCVSALTNANRLLHNLQPI